MVGSVARAEINAALTHAPGQWPWSTLVVNVVGAFLLGYLVTRILERPPEAHSRFHRPLLGTGFCGGLTTFSTMQLELVDMVDGGAPLRAAAYLVLSVSAGLLAAGFGSQLERRGRPPRFGGRSIPGSGKPNGPGSGLAGGVTDA